jgi:hypothetical protein
MNPYLVLETKLFNLSTNSKGCQILNSNKNYQSLCQYSIPNMIVRDESIEYISFSVPYAVIPVSFYIINENNNRLDVSVLGVNTSYFFPYGNYNATYFISQFITLLGSQWNITLNSNNSIFTITNSINNFTICTASNRGRRDHLVEWIEYHKLLGVDHFVMYDTGFSTKGIIMNYNQ